MIVDVEYRLQKPFVQAPRIALVVFWLFRKESRLMARSIGKWGDRLKAKMKKGIESIKALSDDIDAWLTFAFVFSGQSCFQCTPFDPFSTSNILTIYRIV